MLLKKTTVVFVFILSFVILAGCGTKAEKTTAPPQSTEVSVPAGPGPTSIDVKATAEKVLKMIESKNWSNLYDYLYVEIQKTISKDEFVDLRTTESSHSKIEYKNYKVGEAKPLAEWVDKIDGKTYKNVTQVQYTVDVITPRGEMKMQNSMYLIQTPEKNWRYLWIRK